MIYLFIIIGFAIVSIVIHYIQSVLRVRKDYNVFIFCGVLIVSVIAFLLGYFLEFKYHLFFIGYGALFFFGSLVSLAVSYWYKELS
ncbi:hypothetical protein E3U55_08100 [Filobacillus milosensis]|uniref:YesK-like protein n=1 Tax=Filobacillus milosensis TaxID=94137 RepID=A0A4Y8IKX1_9BACI|nr:hypothetical protein [Filobacillus milosensis]TFB21780.1 hypothetical protein E3U55_08100 [Filobacillus milosensis]